MTSTTRRTTTRAALPAATGAVAVALSLALAGCGGGGEAPGGPATSEPPLSTVTRTAPPSSSPPATTATTTAPAPVPTTVGDDALLPESAFAPRDGGRQVREGVEAWIVSTSCDLGSPTGAASMATALVGDGQFEVPVGLQQLAVYADAGDAQAEAQRLGAAMRSCAERADAGPSDDGGNTRYLVEDLAVGADGTGMATDYYGATAGDPDATVIGDYLAVTRRGTAVTLVAESGGEDNTRDAGTRVQALAQEAWERLCAYEVDAC